MSLACAACGAPKTRLDVRIPGFVDGPEFELYECAGCASVSAEPFEIPAGLYEAIYRHARQVAGYERYADYADSVRKVAVPLDYLAAQEPMYWAVKRTLESNELARDWRILEVGSGLGYLTYALREAGYDAQGIDISAPAVAAATRRFGDGFVQGDALHPDTFAADFDLVIALETIEHVPDPLSFIRGLGPLIRQDGALLVTTPNRSVYDPEVKWCTDLPPVHLHWLTEAAVDRMAARLGLDAELVDFTDFHDEHPLALWHPGRKFFQPRLDRDLNPIPNADADDLTAWSRAQKSLEYRLRRRRKNRSSEPAEWLRGPRSMTLAAKLSRA